jgi:hypothetical protein
MVSTAVQPLNVTVIEPGLLPFFWALTVPVDVVWPAAIVAVDVPPLFPVVVTLSVDPCEELKAVAVPAAFAKVTLAVTVALFPPDTVHDQVLPIVPLHVGVTDEEPTFTLVQIMPAADGAVTAKDCWTCGAARCCESPTWLALILHVPAEVNDTVEPEIEHPVLVASRLSVTVRPDVAVAVTV